MPIILSHICFLSLCCMPKSNQCVLLYPILADKKLIRKSVCHVATNFRRRGVWRLAGKGNDVTGACGCSCICSVNALIHSLQLHAQLETIWYARTVWDSAHYTFLTDYLAHSREAVRVLRCILTIFSFKVCLISLVANLLDRVLHAEGCASL